MSNAFYIPTAMEPMTIALRCYADSEKFQLLPNLKPKIRPSRWTVIFDTETHTDAAQGLRFGTYQVRDRDQLHEEGIFYDAENLTPAEITALQMMATKRNLTVRSRSDFVERVLLKYGYDWESTIVGMNLPFDISRIAIRHGSARGSMRGGFTFVISSSPWCPRIQVKHINSRTALVKFTHPGKQLTPNGMRNRSLRVKPHRGYFVDIKTLAAALTATSHSLASLGNFLAIEHRKHETDEHGGPLTEGYIDYALRDVQATWECYRELIKRYHAHGLTRTAAHEIKSEAGMGKAYLRQMGILPFRQLQPDFPPELLGIIMSTYYGGRSEVHIRRQITRVLYCDFLSMYPTVCTLMNLWRFVIANGMTWRDSTIETRQLMDKLTIADLNDPDTWTQLTTLVRIQPQADILPIRAPYGGEPQNTIGLNYLTSEKAQWFTLADCIASKLLTGQPPQVIEATTFEPKGVQSALNLVSIAGRAAYRVNPADTDFYRTVIDLRSDVKRRLKVAKQQGRTEEAERLESEQLALKILANATSYGIFVEVNVEELGRKSRKETVQCYGSDGQSFPVQTTKLERPGTYFHPLLATLITGAARLMLAITERLALDAGIDWAFCDTDSMALAQPAGITEVEFLQRGQAVRGWFDTLNPYKAKGELLKLEEANLALDGSGAMEPLHCFAVSAKRYALFSMDGEARPVIRKASAHGLGHLMEPYTEADAPSSIPHPSVSLAEIGVKRWQYDLWYQIVSAALVGHPDRPELDYHPALKLPAISRYAATTPATLRWFDTHNRNRRYADQVRPFGFMTALQAKRNAHVEVPDDCEIPARPRKRRRVRPVAPYHRDPQTAADIAFDRETGAPVDVGQLATYGQALAQYHLHPEAKFANGDYRDSGPTRRRHIEATGITYIGKEANKWEEQYFLGLDEDAVISYGAAPENRAAAEERVRQACREHGQRAVARASRTSLRDVSALMNAKRPLSPTTLARMDRVTRQLHRQGVAIRRQGRFRMGPIRYD